MSGIRFADRVILFCDVHNFSRIVAQLGADYPRFVQGYYTAMGNQIVHAGGRIIKYIGDAILSLFASDAERDAVACAKMMRISYTLLLKRFCVKMKSELEIGLNSGLVSFGTFGHSSLKMFDVFGPTVNEAAIIMHYRGIAITEKVRRKLPTGIQVYKLPAKKLKWQRSPIRIWAVQESE